MFQSQTLPVDREKLWKFVSVPQNLNQITPSDMAFQMIGTPPDQISPGLFLEYKVKIPLMGWTPWLTEIKYVEEGFSLWMNKGSVLINYGCILIVWKM